jgi:hypothetical protein
VDGLLFAHRERGPVARDGEPVRRGIVPVALDAPRVHGQGHAGDDAPVVPEQGRVVRREQRPQVAPDLVPRRGIDALRDDVQDHVRAHLRLPRVPVRPPGYAVDDQEH